MFTDLSRSAIWTAAQGLYVLVKKIWCVIHTAYMTWELQSCLSRDWRAVQNPPESGFATAVSQQFLCDIADAEDALLRHVGQDDEASSCNTSSRQAALDLISLLQIRAQLLQQPDSRSTHAAEQAKLNIQIQQCRTRLLCVFNNHVLSEICMILHSLYLRKAKLQSCLLSSSEAADNPAACYQSAGSSDKDDAACTAEQVPEVVSVAPAVCHNRLQAVCLTRSMSGTGWPSVACTAAAASACRAAHSIW